MRQHCFVFLIFIYLAVPVLSYGIQTLSCGMWDLLSRPGIKPGPLAMGAPSLSHWTTREVLIFILLCLIYLSQHYAFKSGLYCTMYQDFLSFLRLNSISLCMYRARFLYPEHVFFIHSSVEHLGYF